MDVEGVWKSLDGVAVLPEYKINRGGLKIDILHKHVSEMKKKGMCIKTDILTDTQQPGMEKYSLCIRVLVCLAVIRRSHRKWQRQGYFREAVMWFFVVRES